MRGRMPSGLLRKLAIRFATGGSLQESRTRPSSSSVFLLRRLAAHGLPEGQGEPTPDDKDTIKRKFAEVSAALQNAQDQVDANTAQMAEFQLKLLAGELEKTEEDQAPSASSGRRRPTKPFAPPMFCVSRRRSGNT